jgi:hypothetical protein
VSGSKQIAVTRKYQPSASHCTHALKLLLEKSVKSKEGGPAITAPDDAERRSNASAPSRIIR